MRHWMIAVLLLATTMAFSQELNDLVYRGGAAFTNTPYKGSALAFQLVGFSPVIVDSIVWRVTDILAVGDSTCSHEYVESDTWRAGGSAYCCVDHNGGHCSYDDKMKNRICTKCGRHEQMRERWYEHQQDQKKSPYEQAVEKFESTAPTDGKSKTN